LIGLKIFLLKKMSQLQNNSDIPILTEFKSKHLELSNRVVMAPMTRSRAGAGFVPTDLNRIYYEQRSSAGLIITEGSQISEEAVGYRNTPGIYSNEQVEGWKFITDAVHKKNGKIFIQLWHVGRISHPDYLGGKLPFAPSPIKPDGRIRTYEGIKEMIIPREMTKSDIEKTIRDYAEAAKKAILANFDGVEIHSANCYLLQQFLCDGSNQRQDEYGGSIENRCRMIFNTIEAVIQAIGNNRVGIKLSPSNFNFGTYDSNPIETYDYLVNELNKYDLAYLHLQEPLIPQEKIPERYLKKVTEHYRKIYKGTIITNGNYDFNSGNKAIAEGIADLVSYGRLFISNPDLPERFRTGSELAIPDKETFYDGGEKGYIDYPFMSPTK